MTASKVKSPFDLKFNDPGKNIKPDPEQVAMQVELDKQLKQTFPASDPPTISQTITIGGPEAEGDKRKRRKKLKEVE